MSDELDFDPSDWALLKELPFKVILAAVVVDVRGPVGAASQEMVVAARALVQEATTSYPANSLIMGVLAAVAEEPDDAEEVILNDEEARQAAITEGLALSERARDLFAGRGNVEDSIQYRQWILRAADVAVNATRSGGFLGFGAAKVSEHEQQFIQQLSVALGVSLPEA